MSQIEPDGGNVSIVLVGSFNPSIFNPVWFSHVGLITEKDSDNSEIEILHREISKFKTDWFSLTVDSQRAIFISEEMPFIKLLDLVSKTFGEFLSQTPIKMLGINRAIHFLVSGYDKWNDIGRMLAPIEPWGEWASDIAKEDKSMNGGMRSLTMEETRKEDRYTGWIRAKIEPSNLPPLGITMDINDHFDLRQSLNEIKGSKEIIDILNTNFEPSIKKAEWITKQIMRLA